MAQLWRTIPPFAKSSPAAQAGDILIENLPHSPSTYTFVDQCAGAGGPSPIVEPRLNEKLRARGEKPAKFVLTDLWPHLKEWDAAVKKSDGNLGYVSEPVDATKAFRIAEKGKRECRTFNLCFHHFDDGPAGKVLRSAVETADAFV